MRFEIVGKNVSVTPAMKEKIEKKLSGLEKYLLIVFLSLTDGINNHKVILFNDVTCTKVFQLRLSQTE